MLPFSSVGCLSVALTSTAASRSPFHCCIVLRSTLCTPWFGEASPTHSRVGTIAGWALGVVLVDAVSTLMGLRAVAASSWLGALQLIVTIGVAIEAWVVVLLSLVRSCKARCGTKDNRNLSEKVSSCFPLLEPYTH